MILIAITSFVFGVRVGKNYSYDLAGVTHEDQKKVVELLSKKEEDFAEIKKSEEGHSVESTEIENKLQEKITHEFGDAGAAASSAHNISEKADEKLMSKEHKLVQSSGKDEMSGKFTIQLGSHRTLKEAEDFAEGFKARGYDPIINQIEIKGKGTWYRVSLGAFSTQEDAKSYIGKEKTLFIGQDYTIVKMP
jgi:cell division protein FtsN